MWRRFVLVLIAGLLAPAAFAQPELAPVPIAQEIDTTRLLVVAKGGKPADRVQAIERLGRLYFRDAVPDLLPMLTEPTADIRSAAATALGRLCGWQPEKTDDRAMLPLTKLLKDDAAPVRAAAAWALGTIRVPAAADDLAAVMTKDKDAAVRRAAIIALTTMDDVRAYEPLREVLKTADKQVMLDIAWVLSEKNTPQILDIQLAMLAAGDSAVRGILLEHFSFSRYPGIVPAVCGVMTDPSADVRRKAVECLRMQGDVQAVPTLIAALNDVDPEVAHLAGQTFSWQGNFLLQDKAIPDLLAAMKSPKDSVRAAALEGLYGSKDPRISTAVIPLMSDKDAGVRAAAARTLGGLEDPRALDPLIALLTSPDAKQRASASEALGALKRKEAVAPLLPLLKDPDFLVRQAVAQALMKIHDPSAVDALLAALGDKDEATRIYVVQALGACRDVKAAPVLLALLQTEKSDDILYAVVLAFRDIRDPRCVDLILAFYQTSKGSAHAACLPVLATYPGTQVKDMLLKEMASTDGMTREYAIHTALTNHITDERMTPLLLNELKNVDDQSEATSWATLLLVSMHEKTVIEPLIALLISKSPAQRSIALYGLRALADEKVIPALLPLVNDPDPNIAMEANSVLLHFGYQESLQVMIAATVSKNEMTRSFAMKALSDSGNPQAVAFIQSQFLDPQSPNRLQAAYQLVYSMTPNFLETALAMADGKDQTERKLATLALAGNRDPRTVDIQRRILREGKDTLPEKVSVPWLAQQAAVALAKQGEPEGISWLIDAVENNEGPYANSQDYAASILAEVTGQDFRLDGEKWRAWWEANGKK